MKRLNPQALVVAFIFVALVVALIVALPASRPLMAAPPGQICHVLPDAAPPGVVILASDTPALAVHLDHGDCLAVGGAQLGDSCSCGGCIPPCVPL